MKTLEEHMREFMEQMQSIEPPPFNPEASKEQTYELFAAHYRLWRSAENDFNNCLEIMFQAWATSRNKELEKALKYYSYYPFDKYVAEEEELKRNPQ